MIKFYIFILSFLTIFNSIQAQPFSEIQYDFAKPLAIPELLDIALRNNPETQTAWWNARRAAAATGIAKSAYYPKITFHADALHGRDYKFPNGQEVEFTTFGADLVLTYLLYDFGERKANCDAAKAALIAANWQSNWTIQSVLYQVMSNTYAFLNAQEQLISRNDSLKDAQTTLEAAEELHRVGLRSATDIYTTKATVSDIKMNIALQKAEAEIARGNLAASMGMDVETQVLVATLPEPGQNETMNEGLRCLIDRAQQTRADLMAKRADLKQKIALAEKTRKSYYPKLTLNADAGYRHYLHDKSNGFQYNVGLNFDFPIFLGFESIYQNRMAYSDVKATETELASLELNIALEVLTCNRMFLAAQEILQLSNENLQNSIKSFEGVLDKYKAGTQSVFDLLIAQKQLADARLKYADAKTRWYSSLAQLAYATGSIGY